MIHNRATAAIEMTATKTNRGARRLSRMCKLYVGAVCLLLANPAPGQISGSKFDQAAVFDEVSKTVSEKFWDSRFGGLDWKAISEGWRDRAVRATSQDEFADVINAMLATLKTSHTRYFPATDPRRYQLLGIFDFVAPDSQPELFTCDGIGIDTRNIDGKVFVSAVFDGLPADLAGLRFGDEIVSVDSTLFHPVNSFRGKSGREVDVSVRRVNNGPLLTIKVAVAALNGRTMFADAMDNSVKVFHQSGKKIGYVHLWSYAGIQYHERLVELVLFGKLAACDSLVVDFRDGWGGASLDYVNLFREPLVGIESMGRAGGPNNYTGVWGKPVSLLMNSGSTSGKELYAFAFRKHKLGAIVGGKSAGAVVGGQCIPLSNGDVLYLAVSDLKIDGQRLEGTGVEPDHAVDRPIPYANGADPQLGKAVELLAK